MGNVIVNPGAIKKLQNSITSNTQAITLLNSDANSTNDILASALSCTKTTFFKGSGSSYTGTVPSGNYKYGSFIVNVRGTTRNVLAIDVDGSVATNSYKDNVWQGWNELAEKSTITFDVISGNNTTPEILGKCKFSTISFDSGRPGGVTFNIQIFAFVVLGRGSEAGVYLIDAFSNVIPIKTGSNHSVTCSSKTVNISVTNASYQYGFILYS